MLRAYGVTDKGRVRPTNEDCFAVDESRRLLVVADGMGGHNAGEVAARIAVEAVTEFVAASPEPSVEHPAGDLLRTAIHFAHLQVVEAARTSGEYHGMGTTIVAALVSGDRLTVGHVGDSRLYLATGAGLRQLTLDDSWMNALTNVVGARWGTTVHIAEEALAGGELLLLSTDGVHGVLDDRRLSRLLKSESPDTSVEEVANDVVRAALQWGSPDNCTAIVARYTAA